MILQNLPCRLDKNERYPLVRRAIANEIRRRKYRASHVTISRGLSKRFGSNSLVLCKTVVILGLILFLLGSLPSISLKL
jgi:hypothetical protein